MTREELQDHFGEGKSLQQIAAELGVHGSTVGYWAQKYGLIPTGADRYTAKGAPDRALLERLAAGGASLREMAAEIDRSAATVRYWLDKWGIARARRRKRADPSTAPPIVKRTCSTHGTTDFGLEGRGYYRCLLCRQERVTQWRRRVKRILVSEAGGECHLCGYKRCIAALQFHHMNPADKAFALSHNGVARNLGSARAEARKCVLLCANCHAEVEAGYSEVTTANA
jgi:transposase